MTELDSLDIGPAERFDSPEMRYLTILGRRIGVWRDPTGVFQAMEMVCRHQNGDLSQGLRDGDIVTCPRHGWRYDLTTGDCLTQPWAHLRRYPIEARDGRLRITPRPVG